MMHNMSSRQGCQPAKFDNTLCFNCNAPGHVKKSCNWNAIPDISCQLCQQNGHGAAQCTRYKPKYMNEHARNRVVCQICSKPNLVASECFRYTQQGNPNFLHGGHKARPLGKVKSAAYREHAPFRHDSKDFVNNDILVAMIPPCKSKH
jgi:hypothetical protein